MGEPRPEKFCSIKYTRWYNIFKKSYLILS